MAKKIQATLVEGQTYVLGNKFFNVGVPVEVSEKEKAILVNEFRTFSDPQKPEKEHKVALFEVKEVDDEVTEPAAEKTEGEPPAAPAPARTR
jgi:hypothetical protein